VVGRVLTWGEALDACDGYGHDRAALGCWLGQGDQLDGDRSTVGRDGRGTGPSLACGLGPTRSPVQAVDGVDPLVGECVGASCRSRSCIECRRTALRRAAAGVELLRADPPACAYTWVVTPLQACRSAGDVRSFVKSLRAYLRDLTQQGAILGGCWVAELGGESAGLSDVPCPQVACPGDGCAACEPGRPGPGCEGPWLRPLLHRGCGPWCPVCGGSGLLPLGHIHAHVVALWSRPIWWGRAGAWYAADAVKREKYPLLRGIRRPVVRVEPLDAPVHVGEEGDEDGDAVDLEPGAGLRDYADLHGLGWSGVQRLRSIGAAGAYLSKVVLRYVGKVKGGPVDQLATWAACARSAAWLPPAVSASGTVGAAYGLSVRDVRPSVVSMLSATVSREGPSTVASLDPAALAAREREARFAAALAGDPPPGPDSVRVVSVGRRRGRVDGPVRVGNVVGAIAALEPPAPKAAPMVARLEGAGPGLTPPGNNDTVRGNSAPLVVVDISGRPGGELNAERVASGNASPPGLSALTPSDVGPKVLSGSAVATGPRPAYVPPSDGGPALPPGHQHGAPLTASAPHGAPTLAILGASRWLLASPPAGAPLPSWSADPSATAGLPAPVVAACLRLGIDPAAARDGLSTVPPRGEPGDTVAAAGLRFSSLALAWGVTPRQARALVQAYRAAGAPLGPLPFDAKKSSGAP
jgi:hypothetical protein